MRENGLHAPAVDRALELLEHLGTAAGGLTLSEISSQLGIPKNAVFRITNTLRARGYLSRDDRSLRFTLTDKLVRVTQPRVEKKGLIELSMDAMRELRDATRETVQIGRRFGNEGVILEAVEALHPLRISVDPGLRFPLHNNAPGKLLLAWMPDHAAVIRGLDLVRSTARTITDRKELARECDRIREAGYSVDHAEADEGIHCVAAPIVDGAGWAIATVWVSAPARRMPKSEFAEVGRLAMKAAAKISAKVRDA